MKTLKVLLQEVVSGIKAWVNSNFAQESNTVHKTGNETVNGVKTWTANNTYSANCIIYNSDSSGSVATLRLRNSKAEVLSTGNTASDQSITFRDKNDVAISYIRGATQSNGTALRIGTTARDSSNNTVNTELQLLAFSNGNKAVFPSIADVYNLGLSGYQWKSVYAQNYYYNGTQWGLDQANVWTGNNQFNASVRFNGQTGINWARGGTTGTLPSSVLYYGFQNALDSNDNVFDRIRSYVGTSGTNLQEHIKYAWNDLTKYVTINFWINADGSDSEYKLSVKRVIPAVSNITDLGNSTHKWKTFNGVNPGSLSLPSGGTTENTDWYNVAGDILPIGGNATNFTGGQNFFTPSKDGWLALSVVNCESLAVWISSLNYGLSVVAPNTNENRQLIIPVVAGKSIEIKVKGTRWHYARLIVPQGNV